MRANKTPRERSDAAQVGIGTMIVFIATVLVAAIAAGVLIDTSHKLQERSSRTGNEATDQVASSLSIQRVVGHRSTGGSAGAPIDNLTVYAVLASGANDIDLKELKVQMSNGQERRTVDWATDNTKGTDGFEIRAVRDEDSSFGTLPSGPAVMTSGDLVSIDLDLSSVTGIDLELDPRTEVVIQYLPEVGQTTSSDFLTPHSYRTHTEIELV